MGGSEGILESAFDDPEIKLTLDEVPPSRK